MADITDQVTFTQVPFESLALLGGPLAGTWTLNPSKYTLKPSDWAYDLKVCFTFPDGSTVVAERVHPKAIAAAEALGIKTDVMTGRMKLMHEW